MCSEVSEFYLLAFQEFKGAKTFIINRKTLKKRKLPNLRILENTYYPRHISQDITGKDSSSSPDENGSKTPTFKNNPQTTVSDIYPYLEKDKRHHTSTSSQN